MSHIKSGTLMLAGKGDRIIPVSILPPLPKVGAEVCVNTIDTIQNDALSVSGTGFPPLVFASGKQLVRYEDS
ncbi:hypothetical protein [Arthrobacter sp. UYCo732]|uniref:hypothetical protein n=1 Tax=Arthrobacter sp. UYCo732 TaxID=3156336 RepID=UPI003395BCB1